MREKKGTIIGLTGSIGMGKTTTAKMFRQFDIPVFESDGAVHHLLGPGGAAVAQVAAVFPGVETTEGTTKEHIDRQRLGARVFGDPAALKSLENILHPMVSEMRRGFFDQMVQEGHDLMVIDVPLLFETGADQSCDYTVVVSAPPEIQRERVLGRPYMTAERFRDILAQQMPDDEKRQRADFVVHSDRGLDYAESEVQKIIDNIRENSKVK